MSENQQLAFVLHTRPLSENKQIVDFLTLHDGKLSAVSYISQSKKSDKSALLQAFTPINVVVSGQNNLRTLKRVEAAGKRIVLEKQALYCGFYLNELICRLLPEHIECQSLFQLYTNSIEQLSKSEELEITLRKFELSLLDELGCAIDFSPVFELDCTSFYYIPEQGFIPALQKQNLPCYHQQYLQAIATNKIESKEVKQTFKLLMRQVLSSLLGDKPLNSRKFFN